MYTNNSKQKLHYCLDFDKNTLKRRPRKLNKKKKKAAGGVGGWKIRFVLTYIVEMEQQLHLASSVATVHINPVTLRI